MAPRDRLCCFAEKSKPPSVAGSAIKAVAACIRVPRRSHSGPGEKLSYGARERHKVREPWQVGDTAPDLLELKIHTAVELHLITSRWTEFEQAFTSAFHSFAMRILSFKDVAPSAGC